VLKCLRISRRLWSASISTDSRMSRPIQPPGKRFTCSATSPNTRNWCLLVFAMRNSHRANRHEIPIFAFSVATKDDCHWESFITGGYCCREFLYGSPVIWLSLVVQMANPCDMGSVSIGFSPFDCFFLSPGCMQHAIRCCLDHIIFNRFAFLASLGSWFNESVCHGRCPPPI
jgi:hypothetical protein